MRVTRRSPQGRPPGRRRPGRRFAIVLAVVVAAIVLGVLSALSGRVAVGAGVTIAAVPVLLALLQAASENHGGPGANAG